MEYLVNKDVCLNDLANNVGRSSLQKANQVVSWTPESKPKDENLLIW